MKKLKNVGWGLIIILLAAYLVVNKLELMPADIPFFKIAFAVVFAVIAIKGLIKIEFFEFFMPLAIIVCIFDNELQELTKLPVTKLTFWPIIMAAFLLSVGCEMIFKGVKGKRNKHFGIHFDGMKEATSKDGVTDIESSFNGSTQYISGDIDEVNVENNFGKSVVYFDNAVISNGKAYANVDNNFGATELYIPKTWRVEVKQDVAFGNVKYHGTGNNDMDAPLLIVNVSSNFGEVGIFFV